MRPVNVVMHTFVALHMGTKRAKRQDLGVGIAVVLGAFALWATIIYLAAIAVGWKPLETRAWGRWDTGWYQRIHAVLFHHGLPERSQLLTADGQAWLARAELPAVARQTVDLALRMIDHLDT